MEPVSDSDISDETDYSSSYSEREFNDVNASVDVFRHNAPAAKDYSDDYSDSSDSEDNNFSQNNDTDSHKVLWKSNMSLEDLMAVRDKVGLKKFNKDLMSISKPSNSSAKQEKHKIKRFKRDHKRRPQQLSSKIKVPFLRQVVDSSKPKFTPRDPRFDDLCGSKFNEEEFDKNYSFLDDVREREATELKKTLDQTKDPAKKRKLKYLLRRMKEQKRAKQHRNIMKQVEEQHRKSEIEKIEKGIKKPYFLTKKRRKELYEQKKAEIMKEQGSSNTKKSEIKRVKKLKQKEKKHMPFKRRLET